ncbi:MAG: hypothetical protein WBH31_07180 [Promethearchaeia archaeon]
MKKLAEKLKKIEYVLPKWTRELLYEHIMEVCQDIKEKRQLKAN